MKLSDLEAVGAYASTGYVDIYHEGRHKRLGVMIGDEISLTAEGEAFVASMEPAAPAEPETPAVHAKKTPRAKKAEAPLEAQPAPPGADDDLTAALGDALGDLGA